MSIQPSYKGVRKIVTVYSTRGEHKFELDGEYNWFFHSLWQEDKIIPPHIKDPKYPIVIFENDGRITLKERVSPEARQEAKIRKPHVF